MTQFGQVVRVLKTPVTLILLLAFLGFAAWWGYKSVNTQIAVAETKCVMTDVGKELTPKSVQVRVLNAGGKPLLAKQTANDIRPYGFSVIRVNNAADDRVVSKTVVIGNATNDPEVRLVMQFFPNSVAEADGRSDHVVDVLVGTAFERTPNNPTTTVAVSGPVCLPPATSSTTSATPAASASATPSASPSASKK